MENPKSIVILADGDYPKAEYPLQLLKNADIVICCDASILKLKDATADYIVGDMDTLPPELQKKYSNIIHKSSCQQTNDLTKAFSFALSLVPKGNFANINILGATGRREDHSLGNLSLLVEYAKSIDMPIEPFNNIMHSGITVNIVTDYGIFSPHFNSFEQSSYKGQQISIFSFDNSLKIKSSGLKYQTEGVYFDLWWKATLNESLSDKFSLTFNHKSAILLFRCYPI